MSWLRARFHANYDDSRPVKWPPPGPFWESGFAADESYSVVIAYVKDPLQVTHFWPEATNIEYESCDKILFSSRFQKPDWWKEAADE